SWGAARVISALRSGWSVKGFQEPEELAERPRRPALLLLAAGVADQRAQLLQVGARMLGHVVGERAVVGEQLLAQRLEALVACDLHRGVPGNRIELAAQGRRVDVAHQA